MTPIAALLLATATSCLVLAALGAIFDPKDPS